jgi:hypothetical protein
MQDNTIGILWLSSGGLGYFPTTSRKRGKIPEGQVSLRSNTGIYLKQ